MTTPKVSSAFKAVDLRQLPPPMIIGERLNTQGSRKAKQMVLDDDYDGLVSLGRAQVDDGAHCLDVCVATTERSDEREFMTNLVKRLSLEVDAPLVVDSTDSDVIHAAVRQIPGRPIINSINLEGDGTRFTRLAPFMAQYGIPAIALCIGPDGMAKTADQKLATAQLLSDSGKKYGLAPWQYIFDVLTFTLATGEDEYRSAGRETLEGIKLVKRAFPDSFTVLGISNISFGLMQHARRILNSVFLYHAVRAGLDAAIVNAREMIPYSEINATARGLAEDLIYDRTDDALPNLISHFEALPETSGQSSTSTGRVADLDMSWPPARRANFRIINRLVDGIKNDVVLAIAEQAGLASSVIHGKSDDKNVSVIDAPLEATHDAAIHILNESLLPAMKEVGDRFGSGELILPFVLKSAECMKSAVEELERYLLKEEGSTSKGILVLGTVYGDVHDIGKNLVKTIFQNNGYEVHDLGKQVPLQRFFEKIEEVSPDAVGLSALLVSTSKQMQLFVENARDRGIKVPVMCGGAAINSNYINRIAMPEKGSIYEPGVFYCGTMFDGLKMMDSLVDPDQRDVLLAGWKKRLTEWDRKQKSARTAAQSAAAPTKLETTSLKSKVVSVSPPAGLKQVDLGVPVRLSNVPMTEIWNLLDKRSLFKLSWGIRGKAGQASESDHDQLLYEWQKRVEDEHLFMPRIVYAYFRCHGRGSVLEVEDRSGNPVEFVFPRSQRPEHLCLADYFGADDVVALQAVTVGSKVSDVLDDWNAQDRYSDAYYLHGLAVEASEALAEWTNKKIKDEMGIERGGLRYSWGYPSCPDIAQHTLLWRLLEPERSGMTLTKSGQIVPEHSTAAIVVHHPDARYFVL